MTRTSVLYFLYKLGVKDIRDVIEQNKAAVFLPQNPILFIDEIHRFSKSARIRYLQQ
jgi:putative ATPase